MPREKRFPPDYNRKTAYRERRQAERDAINHVRMQAQCIIPPDPPAPATWFRVRVQTSTGAKMDYIMEESEMERLQSDLRSFKLAAPDAPTLGTYLYANQGPELIKFPGMFVLTFEGASIPATERLESFTPSDTYSIHAGMMDVLLSQKPRPNRRPSH